MDCEISLGLIGLFSNSHLICCCCYNFYFTFAVTNHTNHFSVFSLDQISSDQFTPLESLDSEQIHPYHYDTSAIHTEVTRHQDNLLYCSYNILYYIYIYIYIYFLFNI
ncbi:expressed protein, partial [Phakopsora pachyrhizi]